VRREGKGEGTEREGRDGGGGRVGSQAKVVKFRSLQTDTQIYATENITTPIFGRGRGS